MEHTVTEEVTGIDIVKAQIKIAEGEKIGNHPISKKDVFIQFYSTLLF